MNIRHARRLTGMSRDRFSKAVGVNRGTVKRWEQGTRIPTEERVIAIEQALTRLGVNLANLYQPLALSASHQ
ncbi:helix-turn-helix domain-containing protein [Sphingobium sp. JS3065]|uniref:helix-turn-helix domain-containing protein n=1 Tax=Sphingobium sp. JS3065 TaxID=2970925 RepID=UPI0022650521|nr:helix-turn-helix transcriptional regulator [Sphingobium sp. JS3065]UZW54043.1 helix-turn-helix domain-containing protein [Sphingobium sp. JS3065]